MNENQEAQRVGMAKQSIGLRSWACGNTVELNAGFFMRVEADEESRY